MSPNVLARLYEDEFKKDMLSLKVCDVIIDNVFCHQSIIVDFLLQKLRLNAQIGPKMNIADMVTACRKK